MQESDNSVEFDNDAMVEVEAERNRATLLQKIAAAEYAELIGVPNVLHLFGKYSQARMLQLIKHGNAITPQLYIQHNQDLKDQGLIQAIVNLLASTDKPEGVIGEVIIETGFYSFFWPQRGQLTLKRKTSNVEMRFNEATASPETYSGYKLAQYLLTSKGGRQFEVDIYYLSEARFNKLAAKFVYRRLT